MAGRRQTQRAEGAMRHDGGVSQVMSVDNFLTGLVSVCALRGIKTLSLRGANFYEAFEAAYEVARDEAAKSGVKLQFSIYLDPVYGDSPVVQEALNMAVIRKLISLDNPEYQEKTIKLGKAEARILLRRLPGSPELYESATDKFLDTQFATAG